MRTCAAASAPQPAYDSTGCNTGTLQSGHHSAMDILEAVTRRSSTRAFIDRPVSRETVTAVLDAARWAPSGVNTQPWDVAVLGADTRRRLGNQIIAAREAGTEPNPDYQYYPEQWAEPYKGRRLRCGLAMYGALGIGREDKDKRKAAWYRNYRFFDAPVGLMFTIDRRMPKGSWIDLGMFLENVMLAALGHGLATCPQASLAEYPDIVREVLGLTADRAVVCGMALGYPDPDAAVNSFRTEREAVESFTRWYD